MTTHRIPNPTFLDLKERNERERARLKNRRFLLERRLTEDKSLPPDLFDELVDLVSMTARQGEPELSRGTDLPGGAPAARGPAAASAGAPYKIAIVDPLYLCTRAVLARAAHGIGDIKDHVDGKFHGRLDRNELLLAAVYGLLSADSIAPQRQVLTVVRDGNGVVGLDVEVNDERFSSAVFRALGEFGAQKALFERALASVADQGRAGAEDFARTPQWVGVVRSLRDRGITADHPNLDLLVQGALSSEVSADDSSAPSSIEIDIPDLEAGRDLLVIKNNVLATQVFYASWQLEQARFFEVYDKVEELFLNQLLPIGRGGAADKIYNRWKKGTQRISQPERMNFYATCFGAAAGNPMLSTVNRDFGDIWLRAVSTVSEFARKLTVDDLLRSRVPVSVSSEQVRKSLSELGASLTAHAYGAAYPAATDLQNELNEIIAVLQDAEVMASYGARDLWQLVEQVSAVELGGARNTARSRAMATSGAVIIRWIADHASMLSSAYLPSVLDVDVIRKPSLRPVGVKATSAPTDRDLVDACEQQLSWLAVTDEQVSSYAQPTEAPMITSRLMPQVAKDLLQSVGISAGYSGNGSSNGHRNGGSSNGNSRISAYR